MGPERWAEIERVLRQLLDMPAARRSGALEAAHGDDPELRREVESLLAQDAVAADFLSGGALVPRLPAVTSDEDLAGRVVGSYRLVRLLGSGGMGTVWLADRADAQFEQQVAIKLVRSGLDSREILLRFLQERQVLAQMQHPNIARLLDGGVTDGGRPYLVMEHVDGESLFDYCDRQRLGVHERLRLFLGVCAAVQHAHQHLVVHRDLKPGNILVTADGKPVLLDFGIAKLLQPDTDTNTTRTESRPMTPRYASPEQVSGGAITTASDIYSLGVVLYEFLTGLQPYGGGTQSRSDFERAVRETEPLRPSAAVARSATSAGGPAQLRLRRLGRRLAGDLDAIVQKALRKEPSQRYGSVEQFAEDVCRHLADLPVAARRGTFAYQASRYVRRHALMLIGAAALLLTLAGGVVATVWQAGIASDERDRALLAKEASDRSAMAARRETSRTGKALQFVEQMLLAANPRQTDRKLTADEAFDRAASRVHEDFRDDPGVEGYVESWVGATYLAQGRLDQAEEHLHVAREMLAPTAAEDPVSYANTLMNLGVLAHARGDLDLARARSEEGLHLLDATPDAPIEDIAKGLNNLAAVARAQNRLDDAEELIRRALVARKQRFGEQHPEVAESLNNLAAVLRARQQGAEAEALMRQVVAMREATLGPVHADTLQSLDNLAVLLAERGAWDEAEQLMRRALSGSQQALGPDHPELAVTMVSLARIVRRRGDVAAATSLLEQALRIRRAALPAADVRSAQTARELATCLAALGESDAAAALLQEQLGIVRAVADAPAAVIEGLEKDLAAALQPK